MIEMGSEEGSILVKVCGLFKKPRCISWNSQPPWVLWEWGIYIRDQTLHKKGGAGEMKPSRGSQGSEKKALGSSPGAPAKEDKL